MDEEALIEMVKNHGLWVLPFQDRATTRFGDSSVKHNALVIELCLAVIKAERERCAKICEQNYPYYGDYYAGKIRESTALDSDQG